MTLGKANATPHVVDVHLATFTQTGPRESNQDRVGGFVTRVGGHAAVVLAVADGIGGLDGGEEAASLAIDAVARLATLDLPSCPERPEAVAARLVRSFRRASEAIHDWSEAHPARGPAGSTLTCAVVWRRRYLVAHAGDTRCYFLGPRGACSLTEDHTEAARLARAGHLPPGLAAASPLRHRLTNALGWPRQTWVDVVPGPAAAGELDDGDALLVCSDGVHDVLGEADFADATLGSSDPGAAVQRLVRMALARGTRDNASIALLRVGPGSAASPRGLTRSVPAHKLADGAIV